MPAAVVKCGGCTDCCPDTEGGCALSCECTKCGGAAAHTPDKAVVDCACNVCDCEGGCPLSCECTECCNDHVADCSCDCCPDGCKVDCACEKCGPHNCGHAHA